MYKRQDEDNGEVLEHGDFFVEVWQPEGRPKYTRQWLQQEFSAGRKRELCPFWGHQPAEDGSITKSCLSQWWMEDFWSIADTYLCMEQYMICLLYTSQHRAAGHRGPCGGLVRPGTAYFPLFPHEIVRKISWFIPGKNLTGTLIIC